MKKLISILSVILLVVAFSISGASGEEGKVKAMRSRTNLSFKYGGEKNASLESSSVRDTNDGHNRYQRKQMNMPGGTIDNSLDSSQVGFGTFHKNMRKARKGRNP